MRLQIDDEKNEVFVLPFLLLFTFMAIFFAVYRVMTYGVTPMTYILTISAGLAWLYYPIKKLSRNFTLSANWLIFVLFICQISQSLYSGSFNGTAYWWLIFTPILAAVLLDQIHIILWTLINFFSIMILFLPHVGLIEYRDIIKQSYVSFGLNALMINFSIGAILVTMQERYLRSQKKRGDLKFQAFIQSNFNSLSEMSASVAHEINNPLFVIKGNCDVLTSMLEKEDINPDLKEKIFNHIDKIENATKRATKTTKSLSQLTRGINFEKTETFELSEILKLIYDLNNKKFNQRNIALSIPSDQEMNKIYLNCPKGQIIQVFLNILNNAYEAVYQQVGSWVEIKIDKDDNFVYVKFKDSGSGITLTQSENIFKPLFTTKDPGASKGLGLALSKAILQKNFGDIYIDFRSNNTCFVVKLPIIKT